MDNATKRQMRKTALYNAAGIQDRLLDAGRAVFNAMRFADDHHWRDDPGRVERLVDDAISDLGGAAQLLAGYRSNAEAEEYEEPTNGIDSPD